MKNLQELHNFRSHGDVVGIHSLSPLSSVSFPRYYRGVAANDNDMQRWHIGEILIAVGAVVGLATAAFLVG